MKKYRCMFRSIISIFLFLWCGGFVKADIGLKNVIIISVDTLRADHIGCYGYSLNTTPVTDGLSRDGILFSRCFAPTPLTSPSFATLLTALPPYKHGAKRNGLGLYPDVKTLAFFLKQVGYQSAAFVSSWPLKKKMCRFHVDFDTYEQVFTKKRWWGIMNPEGEAPVINRRVFSWLEKKSTQPFLLWVHYSEPHAPYLFHKKFTFNYDDVPEDQYPPGSNMKKISKYDSEIAYTDYYIGTLLEKLREMDLYQESMIVFHADHGESFGEHNYYLHGRKLYNSSLHVPLIIKLPGNAKKNQVRSYNTALMDVGTTIFSVLKLPIPDQFDGLDLLGDAAPFLNREILLEAHGGVVLFRRNDKEYQRSMKPIRYGFIKGNFKYIYNPKNKHFEFFDLGKDFFETRNLFFRLYLQNKDIRFHLLDEITKINDYLRVEPMNSGKALGKMN
jgi:arylsulfatase A-like enzyme